MSGTTTGYSDQRYSEDRPGPIDEILRRKGGGGGTSRYGDGARHQAEREQVRESYLAMDVRLRSGEYQGLFYHDLEGRPMLDAAHTVLTVPFRDAKLVIRGMSLIEVYRAVLHHSLDVLEETHRPEFTDGGGEDGAPVIESIEIIERRGEQ